MKKVAFLLTSLVMITIMLSSCSVKHQIASAKKMMAENQEMKQTQKVIDSIVRAVSTEDLTRQEMTDLIKEATGEKIRFNKRAHKNVVKSGFSPATTYYSSSRFSAGGTCSGGACFTGEARKYQRR